MKEIIVLSGTPGAGKSFMANLIHQKYLETSIIINNDMLRMMLTGTNESNIGSTYERSNFEDVRDYIVYSRNAIIKAFLSIDKIEKIIVDACHFSKESIAFFKELKEVEIVNVLLDTDLEEAFKNAQSRTRKEGKEIIAFIKGELEELDQEYDFVLKNEQEKKLFLESI